MSLIRDYILSKSTRAHFPLHYVLIAGIGGALPDIDIVFSVILKMFGSADWWIHKTFTHSLFFPLTFLVIFMVFHHTKDTINICSGKHKMRISLIALMLAIGTLTHIMLDTLAGQQAFWLYPLILRDFGVNLFSYVGLAWGTTAALLDGILLVIWIVYLELKHKISDFI
jgi:hypothetical protein